ncbi:hypothetical protein [Pseudoalteromonas sp. SWXJZ94C]|uniref:hypothetical protein n=1 Tax=Pseudoalteromonas sp. SWXJZ94C TaxID=2792065 RepID=UPI001E578704|nr:hypothetical protein [Pseudoalteromonas sp. SWXJZ94C]
MKILVNIIFLLISYSTFAHSEEIIEGPIAASSYTFCHLDTKCITSIRLANTMPYQVKLSSLAFDKQGIDLNSMFICEVDAYFSLRAENPGVKVPEQPIQGRWRAHK